MLDPKQIVEEIKNGDGIVVLPEFISGNELHRCRMDFDIKMSNIPITPEYKFGKATRTGRLEDNTQNFGIFATFNRPSFKEIAREYFGTEPSFSELFWTHEFRTNLGTETNGFLHFDKIGPTLKFFLYLTDASRKSGAFRCVRGTQKQGKQLRERTWLSERDYSKLKNKPEIDYPELGYTAEDAEDITGLAGTLFIFDTDLFHMGGICEEGFERRVVRLHVRK